jgi:hypothetical protein
MSSPLTLIMPIIPGTSLTAIAATLAENTKQIDDALKTIGTVHFARFLLLDSSKPNLQPDLTAKTASNSLVLGVITEYDGNFNMYIQDFVSKLGGVFDALLEFVVDGKKLIPVDNNVAAFQAYITLNDASQHIPNADLYQAYPQTVQKILAVFPPQ